MTRHVSTENLARFRADDLSSARSARVAAHLRRCASCRQTSDDLAEVPSLLARVPAPPMPAHLAARIETALAAEAAQRAEGAGARPGTAEPAPRGSHARRRAARRPVLLSAPGLRVMAVAGAAVVVVGGGVALLSQLGGSTSSGSSGAAGTPSHQGAKPATGHQSFNAAAEPAQVPYHHDGHTSLIKPVQSGTDYQRARLTQQVNQALADNQGHSKSGLPDATPGENFRGLSQPSSLGGCISLVAAGSSVLLVDVAQFDHKPATVIVTRGSGSAPEQVWVVGSRCSATTKNVLAHGVLSH